MNKFLFNVLAALLLSVGFCFTSCSDDDDDANLVNVKFAAAPLFEGTLSVSQLEGMTVVFTETRSQDKTTCLLNAAGEGEVRLALSTYDIAIEETIKNASGDDMVVSLRMENISVNQEGQRIEGKVNTLPASALGNNLIFSEVFFNGETNSGQMMHPDQYVVIYNPSNETLYADGLSIGLTLQWSRDDKSLWYDEYYPNRVPISGFITIPGTGKEHAVEPGERFVIAFTAINHKEKEGFDNSVDLSGADFEIYDVTDKKDVDNVNVPNVLLTESISPASRGFFVQPRGYASSLLFKLENGNASTVEAFLRSHTTRSKHLVKGNPDKGTQDEIIEIDILSVDTKDILDGLQTSDVPQDVKTRTIPETVDRGKFLVSGCHRQELAIRKSVVVDGKVFYQDTNNSTEDFIMQKGQNAFPVGWRNK